MAKILNIYFFVLGTCMLLGASSKHPLHVSSTDIHFNKNAKTLEITSRIFTDDFENILAKKYQTKVDLSSQNLHAKMNDLIKKYMNENLKYMINGNLKIANYIGFEIDKEAVNVYLEITNVAVLQKITIHNTLLYDLFNDQMSILHVDYNGVQKSTRTNYPQPQLEILF